MTTDVTYAPGCFGSALTYAEDDICAACSFREPCKPVHEKALAALHQSLGIVKKEFVLPDKVQKVFDELGISKESIRETLLGGVNPFQMSKGYMGIVCHVLLKRPASRSLLAQVIERHRGIAPKTAETYARYAVTILAYCSIVHKDGDLFSIGTK
jgi:hypothetical protein